MKEIRWAHSESFLNGYISREWFSYYEVLVPPHHHNLLFLFLKKKKQPNSY